MTSSRWFARGAAALGVLLCLPSLGLGLIFDDWVHAHYVLEHLRDPHAAGAWWDMFDLMGRSEPSDVPARIAIGLLPWWTSHQPVFAFLRPLAAASHYLDYIAWPEQPWLMHVHNLGWYALAVVCALACYRRACTDGATAGVATLLYAVDEAHAEGVAWVAARNTLMTAAFGFGTVVLWLRARAPDAAAPRVRVALAVLALLCAHASSEGAVAVWAYLLAYAWVLDPAGRRAGLRALWPLAAVTAAWQALATIAGYRLRGGGSYIDPRSDPLRFAQAVVERLPQVLRELLGLPRQLVGELPEPWQQIALPGTWVVLGLALIAGWPLVRDRPGARFFALGMMGSAVLACSAMVQPRLLFLVGLGAHGVLAEGLVAGARTVWSHERRASARRWLLGAVVLVLALVHGPIAALYKPRAIHAIDRPSARVTRIARSLPVAHAPDGPLIALNTNSYLLAMFVTNFALGARPPRFVYVLGTSLAPVKLSRPRADSLVLEPEGGYLSERTSQIVRHAAERFRAGQTVSVNDWKITVERITADGRPARVRVVPTKIDDPVLTWAAWSEERQRFVQVELPKVGESLWLPGGKPAEL